MGRESRVRQFPTEEERERRKLLAFAQAVRNEDHWQEILAKSPNDEVREELDRVVGPMLRWRRGCAHVGCLSNEPAAYRVLLRLGYPDRPARETDLGITVCHPCRDLVTVDDVLTDDLWSGVIQQCVAQAEAIPVRGLCTLRFEGLPGTGLEETTAPVERPPIRVRQYIPNFVDGVEPVTAEVASVEELLALDWVKHWEEPMRWARRTNAEGCPDQFGEKAEAGQWLFYRWSLSDNCLLVEHDFGFHWWVVATLSSDAGIEGLPAWDQGRYRVEFEDGTKGFVEGREVGSSCGDQVTLNDGRVLKNRRHDSDLPA